MWNARVHGSGVNLAAWIAAVIMLLIPFVAPAQDAPGPAAGGAAFSETAQRVLTEGVAPSDNDMARVFGLTPGSTFKEKAIGLSGVIHRIQVNQKNQDIILARMIHYGTPQYEITLYLTSVDGSLRKAFQYRRSAQGLQELPLSRAKKGFDGERMFWLKWRGGTNISP